MQFLIENFKLRHCSDSPEQLSSDLFLRNLCFSLIQMKQREGETSLTRLLYWLNCAFHLLLRMKLQACCHSRLEQVQHCGRESAGNSIIACARLPWLAFRRCYPHTACILECDQCSWLATSSVSLVFHCERLHSACAASVSTPSFANTIGFANPQRRRRPGKVRAL